VKVTASDNFTVEGSVAAENLTEGIERRALKLTERVSGLNDGLGDGLAIGVGDVDGEMSFVAHGITSRD
jgi:hypothetical protein